MLLSSLCVNTLIWGGRWRKKWEKISPDLCNPKNAENLWHDSACQNSGPKKLERDSAKLPFLVAQWLGTILCTLLANSAWKEIKTDVAVLEPPTYLTCKLRTNWPDWSLVRRSTYWTRMIIILRSGVIKIRLLENVHGIFRCKGILTVSPVSLSIRHSVVTYFVNTRKVKRYRVRNSQSLLDCFSPKDTRSYFKCPKHYKYPKYAGKYPTHFVSVVMFLCSLVT